MGDYVRTHVYARCTAAVRNAPGAIEKVTVRGAGRPELTLQANGESYTESFPNLGESAWQYGGLRAVTQWFALSRPDVPVYVEGSLAPSSMLLMQSNLVWQNETVSVYQHDGPGLIYWVDAGGVYDDEAITGMVGSTFAVRSKEPLGEDHQARFRELITVMRNGQWRLPPQTADSSSLDARLLIGDVLTVQQPFVATTAAWLRKWLPQFKVGVASLDDVRAKLELEGRLRIEENVTGSLRPLALTLEAIDDATFAWPGLWMVSGRASDVRRDFHVLLAWDAVLAAICASTRLHVDYKPGLVYGTPISQSFLTKERRFSKRDAGVVDSTYTQVNPARVVGSAAVIASRLIQAATHELTHLWLGEFETHSELFTYRREYLLSAALDLESAVIELVQLLGLHLRPSRALVVPPVTLDQWLHEQLIRSSVVSVTQLVRGWGAVRNLTQGRAERDIYAALTDANAAGLCFWKPGWEGIVSRLRRG